MDYNYVKGESFIVGDDKLRVTCDIQSEEGVIDKS